MANILSEVEERMHEKGLADGLSNPMAQHSYDGFAKRQSRSASWLVLGATAVGLVLILALIFGVWLLRSVRRLNRQVAHLNRQTEQLNHRLQGAEQQVKSLDEKASQAPVAPIAALRPDEVADQVPHPLPDEAKESEATLPARAQSPVQSETAGRAPRQAAQITEETRKARTPRDEQLDRLKQSLGQIAETRRTADGVVMTLGDKSLRFASGQSNIAPQYRGTLNRIAGVLKTAKGDSIHVYGYTDENGTKDDNLRLSARRAQAVRDFLVKAGIDPSLISTKGFGKSKPRVRGSNPQARAANRRVEIGIISSTLVTGNQPISRK